MIPDWINNNHADYVLAAYATAAIILIALVITSLRDYRLRQREWQTLSRDEDQPQ